MLRSARGTSSRRSRHDDRAADGLDRPRDQPAARRDRVEWRGRSERLNCKKPDRDQARDAFSRIVRDSARASVVIRGLWASSRSSVHNWPHSTSTTSQEKCWRSPVASCGATALGFTRTWSPGDRPVLGARVQLQQVVLNLIMNGVEAMSGVTERTRELTVSYESSPSLAACWFRSKTRQGA